MLVYLALTSTPGLRQGLFARGGIELDRRVALAVPTGTLRNDQSRPTVIVAADGMAQLRVVEPGARGEVDFGQGPEAAIELRSGVREGETVLRATVGALPPGTRLRLPAAAAPAASAASAPRP